MLRRLAVCLIYAHWEGFVKIAAQAYLDYVHRQGLDHQDLADSILALAL